jgi:hypothetical protein
MFDDTSEIGIQSTPEGMAHWAGSGPGRACRECEHYTFEGRHKTSTVKYPKGLLKPGWCRLYAKMMKKKKGPKFPFTTKACKYFTEREVELKMIDPSWTS